MQCKIDEGTLLVVLLQKGLLRWAEVEVPDAR